MTSHSRNSEHPETIYNPVTGIVKDQIAKARSLGIKWLSVVDINFDSFSLAKLN